MGRLNPLVAIGLPTWGRVSVRWARAYRHLGGPLGAVIVELEPAEGKPIAQARNELMIAAIQNGADFLFFIGDDVLCPGDTITRMLHRMWDDPDLDLLTGVYWTKTWPTAPYIWRGMQRGPYLDWRHGEYFQVDQAGCDCLMIRLSDRIKALPEGWQERDADGPDWFSTSWLWEPAQEQPDDLATEDFYFYTRAREAGIKLMCDTNIQCLHEDRTSGQLFGLTLDMPQAGAPEPEWPEPGTDAAPLVKLAEIGCGDVSPYFGRPDRVRVFRFDGNERVRPDYRCDLRQLPVPDESFDVVHSRHVLEHFGRDDVMRVMREWTRILRVGGEFRIGVPNLAWTLDEIRKQEAGETPPDPYAWWQLYGQQTDAYDFHRNGFTPRRLRELLDRLGCFEDIDVTEGDGGINLYGKARKVRSPRPYSLTDGWDRIQAAEGFRMPGMRAAEDVTIRIDGEPVADAAGIAVLVPEAGMVETLGNDLAPRTNGHAKKAGVKG